MRIKSNFESMKFKNEQFQQWYVWNFIYREFFWSTWKVYDPQQIEKS